MSFWRAGPDGVTVMVKVQPRSKRPGSRGMRESGSGPRLGMGVAEAAEDGKANRAVCEALAGLLDCPTSSVRIATGASHREKLAAVTGDSSALVEKLRAL